MTDPGVLATEALKQVSAVLRKLTAEELLDLVSGRGQLVYQSADALVPAKGARRRPATDQQKAVARRPKAAFDAAAAATAVQGMSTADEIVAHLGQRGFTIANLKQLATAIGPSVVLTGRRKDEIVRDIADAVAGYRQRSAAMSGGGWG